jgi:ubiquinone/menaquinone biosynthesis C-methylase UbiE
MPTAYDSTTYAKVNHLDPHHPRRVAEAFPDLAGRDVLEVGCGRGHLLEVLQRAGARAVGLDANPQAVANGATSGMLVADATHLPFPDASFDALVSVHTIEHLPGLDDGFAEMARVVRPGGRLLLIYPAEPIMGLWAVPTAVILHRNPFKARQVHCQKLTPSRVQRRVADLPLAHVWSAFSWRGWPQYTTVLDRVG